MRISDWTSDVCSSDLQRSAQAAKEIKGLIEESQHKVQAGAQQPGQAGEVMREVVGSVQGVTTIMGEIASASHEQSEGIEQVNQTVTQMEGVVQQRSEERRVGKEFVPTCRYRTSANHTKQILKHYITHPTKT